MSDRDAGNVGNIGFRPFARLGPLEPRAPTTSSDWVGFFEVGSSHEDIHRGCKLRPLERPTDCEYPSDYPGQFEVRLLLLQNSMLAEVPRSLSRVNILDTQAPETSFTNLTKGQDIGRIRHPWRVERQPHRDRVDMLLDGVVVATNRIPPVDNTLDPPSSRHGTHTGSSSLLQGGQFGVSELITVTVDNANPPPPPDDGGESAKTYFEAEQGTLVAPMTSEPDPTASGGGAVSTSSFDLGPSLSPSRYRRGSYVVWAKVLLRRRPQLALGGCGHASSGRVRCQRRAGCDG